MSDYERARISAVVVKALCVRGKIAWQIKLAWLHIQKSAKFTCDSLDCLQRKYGLFCLELKVNSCQQNLFDKMNVLFTFAIVLVNLERIYR